MKKKNQKTFFSKRLQNLGFHQESIDCYKLLLERTIPENQTLYLLYNGIAQASEASEQYENAAENYILALKYVASSQNLNILSKLCYIYDHKLNHFNSASYYYNWYLGSLKVYRNFLSEQNPVDSVKIKEFDDTIFELEKYLVSYKEQGDR